MIRILFDIDPKDNRISIDYYYTNVSEYENAQEMGDQLWAQMWGIDEV